MKHSMLILICLSLFNTDLFSQDIDSIQVKGYYLVVYPKMQIENIEKNKEQKKAGKPYFEALGTESYSMFIPSEDVDSSLSESIKKYKYDYRDVNFFLPQRKSDRKYIIDAVKGKDSFTLETAYFKDSGFYYSPAIPDRLFRIYYIEGKGIKYHMKNTVENRHVFGLFLDDIAKGETFDVVICYGYSLVANAFTHLYEFTNWSYKKD